ncbi:hypothetical protein, partial [Vibrio cholerae]|uniref:hypothetical protein n=1 Tax=Vibrio cholerae TaxID=666 RepID=UPI000A222455
EFIQNLSTKNGIKIVDKTRKELIGLLTDYYKNKPIPKENLINIQEASSLKGYFQEYILTNSNDNLDISDYLESQRNEIKRLIEKQEFKNKKGQLSLACEYERKLVNGDNQTNTMYFSLKSSDIFNVDGFIDDQFKKLILRENLNQPSKGSGWSLKRCLELNLKLSKHNSLNAGSYVELSSEINNKKCCINFQNKDEYCFIYAIRCAIDKYENKTLDHPQRVRQYQNYLNDEIFKGFDYPMSLKDIKLFEKRSFDSKYNYPSMSINVYRIDEDKKIVPLQISENYNTKLD